MKTKKQIFPIEFETIVDRLPHLMGMHYIEIPAGIIQKMGGTFSRRLICTLNAGFSFRGGLVALGGGKGYISITKKKLKDLNLKPGDIINVKLEPDDSEYGMDMPEELAELLSQDPEGKRRFDQLTAGRKRYIIHYISTVKNIQLRIDRAVLLIGNLKKLPEGKEDFGAMLGKRS